MVAVLAGAVKGTENPREVSVDVPTPRELVALITCDPFMSTLTVLVVPKTSFGSYVFPTKNRST